ncbi:hypothetical protein [Rubrivirga sp.]|uniref:hypothetical protein n=1 Tax=Rubrivirga sp. TaxID=1885344 RepID=UPI003B52E08F
MSRLALACLLALVALASAAQAQSDDRRRIVLTNGDIYVGVVVDGDSDPIVIRTTDGVERRFARADVAEIAPLINGRFFRTDPVKTRLFLSPTARTLGGGEFRGDLTYFYPSITAGLGDRVDLLASGFVTVGDNAFVTPLVGLKAQVYATESTTLALGTSALFAFGDGTDGAFVAAPYAVATFGDETRAVTVGAGGFFGGSLSSLDVEVSNAVVVGLGAETQLNNGVKLFVENLVGFGEGDSGLLVLPGVRFFGDRFAFDVIGFLATDFENVVGFAPIGARASYGF